MNRKNKSTAQNWNETKMARAKSVKLKPKRCSSKIFRNTIAIAHMLNPTLTRIVLWRVMAKIRPDLIVWYFVVCMILSALHFFSLHRDGTCNNLQYHCGKMCVTFVWCLVGRCVRLSHIWNQMSQINDPKLQQQQMIANNWMQTWIGARIGFERNAKISSEWSQRCVTKC